MKHLCSTILFLIIFMSTTTETAFAGSALELTGVSNGGGGPTFTFRVTGEFSQNELNNGTVKAKGSETISLSCTQIDPVTVVCHAAKTVSGQEVVINFGGTKFWAGVPQPSLGNGNGDGNEGYCYEVYGVEFLDKPNLPVGWDPQDQYCQGTSATQGDEIDLYTPSWGTTEPYVFWENGVYVFDWDNPGTGYFWNWH